MWWEYSHIHLASFKRILSQSLLWMRHILHAQRDMDEYVPFTLFQFWVYVYVHTWPFLHALVMCVGLCMYECAWVSFW